MCDKRKYETLAKTKKQIKYLNREKQGYDIIKHYFCKECGAFHITTQEDVGDKKRYKRAKYKYVDKEF